MTSGFFDLKDPKHRYSGMQTDVQMLYKNQHFAGCATLIFCYIDALGAGKSKARKGKFGKFVRKNFPGLVSEIEGLVKGQKGEIVLYEKFRNGLAHLRGPKSGFALVENQEVNGKFAGKIKVGEEKEVIGINIDTLATEFLKLVGQLKEKTG